MPDYSEQLKSLELEKAYLKQFEIEWQITNSMYASVATRFSDHDELLPLAKEIAEARDGYYRLKKGYKRMKWANFVKRADELFAKTTELKVVAQEALQEIVASEYAKELQIEVTTIKPEETPGITDLKKEVFIKPEEKPIRGGSRPGAGRPSKGVKRPVSITLPQEEWDWIEAFLAPSADRGKRISLAEYFRDLAILYRDEFTQKGSE